MNSGVKIIKRNRIIELQSSTPVQEEKSGQQNERDIASTVKSWIVDLAQRKMADEQSARMRFFAEAH